MGVAVFRELSKRRFWHKMTLECRAIVFLVRIVFLEITDVKLNSLSSLRISSNDDH